VEARGSCISTLVGNDNDGSNPITGLLGTGNYLQDIKGPELRQVIKLDIENLNRCTIKIN
jgi:hypothetical protein